MKKKYELKGLEDKIYITRKSRINAAQRLKKWHYFISCMNIYYSGITVVFSIMSLLFQNQVLINLILISSSVLAISFSAVSISLQYNERALRYKNCYVKLDELYGKVHQAVINKGNENNNLLENYQNEYNKIIEESENHETIDYYHVLVDDKFQMEKYLERYSDNKKKYENKIKIKYYFNKFLEIIKKTLLILAPFLILLVIYVIQLLFNIFV